MPKAMAKVRPKQDDGCDCEGDCKRATADNGRVTAATAQSGEAVEPLAAFACVGSPLQAGLHWQRGAGGVVAVLN